MSAPRRCEARIGEAPGTHGFVPIPCTQSVGVAIHVGLDGTVHGACTAPGHREQVVRQFGTYPGELAADAIAALDGHREAVRS